eukprot:TRINITY_DN14685_c0_g2_i1.p1 TRINITY_DN14685_c0_g2~~TRINITY_DN14685_c0_g2_i1.p1  ORF type:complete len:557 (+),score=235.62 TRINITY_DN14685_c0_g2_i1:116-1786(+)
MAGEGKPVPMGLPTPAEDPNGRMLMMTVLQHVEGYRGQVEELQQMLKSTMRELEVERAQREFETRARVQLQEEVRKLAAEKSRLHMQCAKEATAARKIKHAMDHQSVTREMQNLASERPIEPQSVTSDGHRQFIKPQYIKQLEDGAVKDKIMRLEREWKTAKQAATYAGGNTGDTKKLLDLANAENALLRETMQAFTTREEEGELLRVAKADYSNMIYRETVENLVKEVQRMQHLIAVLTYQTCTTAIEHGGENPLNDLGPEGYGELPEIQSENQAPEKENDEPANEETAPSGMNSFVFERYISMMHGDDDDSAEEMEENEETEEPDEGGSSKCDPAKWGQRANAQLMRCLRDIRNERRKELRREKDKIRRCRPKFCTLKHERKVKEGLDNGMPQYEVADVLQFLKDGALERRETKESNDMYLVFGLPLRGVMYCPVSDKSKISSAVAVRRDLVEGGAPVHGPRCISTRAFMEVAATGAFAPEVFERERVRMGEMPALLEGSGEGAAEGADDAAIEDILTVMIDNLAGKTRGDAAVEAVDQAAEETVPKRVRFSGE